MEAVDLRWAHGLSVEVGWPHRPEDWRFIMRIGEGFVACDRAERILGCAMWWPFGPRFATIGMFIVSPRLQAKGAGRALMEAVLEAARGRSLRLNATASGYRLYESYDFKPDGRVFQHQGTAKAILADEPAASGWSVRPASRADRAKIAALDAAAYGADRTKMLDALAESSTGMICERGGAAVGFSLCRPFGRGHAVGPIVAEDDAMAVALTAPHVRDHGGTFLRVDTAFGDGGFAAYLEDAGLVRAAHVTTMARGAEPEISGPARIFGAVNQALG